MLQLHRTLFGPLVKLILDHWPEDCGDCSVRPLCWPRQYRCVLEDIASAFTPDFRTKKLPHFRIEIILYQKFRIGYSGNHKEYGQFGGLAVRYPISKFPYPGLGFAPSLLRR